MQFDRRQLMATLGAGMVAAPSPGAGTGQRPPGLALHDANPKAAWLGDWIGGRDDVHLQRAIDALAAPGGVLYVEPGAPLRLVAPIRLRSGVHVVGLPSGLPAKANYGRDLYRIDVTAGERRPDDTAILMEPSSSIAGFTLFWPGQKADAAGPTDYGWALGTSGVGAGADNILIERMMLTNPWRGINMDHGGQWRVSDVYGQPIDIGLRVDRMLDVSQVSNVHWWDFAVQAGPIHDHILAHATGFLIGRADGLMASRLFGYNLHTLLKFVDFGSGPAWAQIDDALLDRGIHAIDVQAINKLQIDRLVATQPNSGIGQPIGLIRNGVRDAQVGVTGAMFDNVSNGIVIEDGASGRFTFTGLSSQRRIGNGDNQQYDLVVEGETADVVASGIGYRAVAGAVALDGMKALSLDRDVTPPRFASPHLWAPAARIKSIPEGASFDLAGPMTVAGFAFPASISQEIALFVIDATLSLKNKDRLGPGQFYLRMTDGTVNDIVLPSGNFGCFFERPTRIIKPFPIRSDRYRLEFVFGGTTGPCAMNVTRLRLWRLDPATLDPRLLDWVYASAPNGGGLASNASLLAGARITRQSGPPIAGTHRAGDRVIALDPAAARTPEWICTRGGSPGIWQSGGALLD